MIFTDCRSQSIDPLHFGTCSSLLIVAIQWHPLSPTHLVILSNDGMIRIYNVAHSTTLPMSIIHTQSSLSSNRRAFHYNLDAITPIGFQLGLDWNYTISSAIMKDRNAWHMMSLFVVMKNRPIH